MEKRLKMGRTKRNSSKNTTYIESSIGGRLKGVSQNA